MGTSGGPAPAESPARIDHKDRLAKLKARKRELEALLSAKNDLLYKLCVRELALTGVVPPEAPPLPSVPSESDSTSSHSHAQLKETVSAPPPLSHPSQQSPQSPPSHTHRRKQTAHRLSTPNSSASNPHLSQPETQNDFKTHPHILPSAGRVPHKTLPSNYSRHHTVTTEHFSKYYSLTHPEVGAFSQLQETHFSSSHPDIAAQHSRTTISRESQSSEGVPLLYQYASQLKARSPHLSGLPRAAPAHASKKKDPSRRNALQRTQTYHLTSHSDYNGRIESSSVQTQYMSHGHRQPFAEVKKVYGDQYSIRSDQTFPRYPPRLSPQGSLMSRQFPFGDVSPVTHSSHSNISETKVKEKEWYESSLDSPSNFSSGLNLSRESYDSLKKPLQRSPSVSQPHLSADNNSNVCVESQLPTLSPSESQCALSPRAQISTDVPFESPKYCTVIETGKWIPYREVSKPFEMSDFYKYSTKFRQNNNNNNTTLKSKTTSVPCSTIQNNIIRHEDLHTYPMQENWKYSS